MSKIVVPEGMLKAVMDPTLVQSKENILRVALLWLSDNPVVPTQLEAESLSTVRPVELVQVAIRSWQRRMFLAPEPEVPQIRCNFCGECLKVARTADGGFTVTNDHIHPPTIEVPEPVKRFGRFDFNPHDGEQGMEPSPDGDYVLYSDMLKAFVLGQKYVRDNIMRAK